MRYLFLTILLTSTLFSKNVMLIDNDFDGVLDAFDKCLNTPFEYEVDESGCKRDALDDYRFFSSYSYGYSKKKADTSSFTSKSNKLSAFIAKDKFMLGLSNSYMDVESKDLSTNTTRKVSGFGDLIVILGYMPDSKYISAINLISKIATADKTLSSGENDYSIEVDFQNFDHDIFMIGSMAYNYLGDSEVNFKNYFSGSLGFGKSFYKEFYFIVDFFYTGPAVENGDDELDLQSILVIPYDQNYQFNLSYTTNLNHRDDFKSNSLSFQIKMTF